MGTVISVNPFRCRMWALHDRLESTLNETTCKEEIESFRKHGQMVPVLGRALIDEPDFDIELIFGARRLFVAQHVNRPIRVEIRELSDLEAVVAMDIENRQRRDVSPYERGLCYARWLREGIFGSQEEIARALGVSASRVSKLLKIARLPAVVVGAFECPTHICEMWGLQLADIWQNVALRDVLAERARSISKRNRRPAAQEIYRVLSSVSSSDTAIRVRKRDQVVTDCRDRPLFRVRHQRRWVALLLPVDRVTSATLHRIQDRVADVLDGATEDATRDSHLTSRSTRQHGNEE